MTYDPHSFPPFAVTVDIVLFTVSDTLEILLVERGGPPFEGAMALPGGFVTPDESVTEAAWRELAEETGLEGDLLKGVHLEQLATFGAVDRDPRMRVVSVAHVGLCSVRPELLAGTDARDAVWVDVSDIPELAFDHDEILATGLERVRAKLEYTTLATSLAGDDFTLRDLHRIYEVVWGIELDLANFRRKVLATDGFVERTGQKRMSPAGGAPAAVYRAGTATHLSPPLVRPT